MIREVHRLRDKKSKELNGCAIVTFGSVDAAQRALSKTGATVTAAMKTRTITVAPSQRRRAPKRAEDADGGGARFDAVHNKMFPHETPAEMQFDFKKRRIAYPGDHNNAS